MIEPESRYFESSRLRIHYNVWGDESQPALVLVHGGRDHARSWDFVAQRLIDRYAVYAMDLRGHGDSDWTAGPAYQLSNFVADLDALLKVLGRNKVDLVGHSLGGRIVTDYAGAFPEGVNKIVSIEGFGRPPSDLEPPARLRRFIDQVRESESFSPRVYPSLEVAEQRRAEANKRLTPEMVKHLTRHAVRPGPDGGYVWKFDPFQSIRPAPDWSRDDFKQLWSALEVPVLLIVGRDSFFMKQRFDLVEAVLPESNHVIVEEAGHWVHHDQLDLFVNLTRDFLS